jgi:hypothetical protein
MIDGTVVLLAIIVGGFFMVGVGVYGLWKDDQL